MTNPLLPPQDLERFFSAFAAMLELRSSAAEVEQSVGSSASGTHRLGFYGVLARRSRFLALRQLCPALRHCALSYDPPLWEELVVRYARAHPPDDPDPNRFGAKLSDFLDAWSQENTRVPAYFAEVADFEYSEWAVGIEDFEPSSADVGLDRTLRVRHYDHDVARFVFGFRSGSAAARPDATPTAVIIHRDLRSSLPQVFFPTALGLHVLGLRCGLGLAPACFTDDAALQAERDLETHGVLPPRERS